MSIPVIAFFNNKGGVGKTSLVYHLGWTFADLGRRVLMIDMDGARVGQVNGLTVYDLGDYRFGGPTKITAAVSTGPSAKPRMVRRLSSSSSG